MARKRRFWLYAVRAMMYSLATNNVILWLLVLLRPWLVANRDDILVYFGFQLGGIALAVGLIFFFRWLDRKIYK